MLIMLICVIKKVLSIRFRHLGNMLTLLSKSRIGGITNLQNVVISDTFVTTICQRMMVVWLWSLRTAM